MLTAVSVTLPTLPSLSLRPSPLLSPPRLFPSSLPKFKSYARPGIATLPLMCLPGPIRDVEKSEDAKEMPSSTSNSDISSYSWCAALGGVGFLETAYLTYSKLTNSEAFCPVGGGSCSDVLNSDYAMVLGVPLPLIGMTAYGFVLFLGLKLGGWNLPFKINQSDGRLLLLSVTSSMAAASAYFLYTLSTKFAGASCSYCLASAVLSFSLFFIILKDFGLQELQKVVVLPLCTASIVLAVLSTTYSSLPPSSSSAEVNLPYYATEITTESSPFAIALARHLHSIGAKMYGAFWCSHCQEQKQMFGREAAQSLDYVECFPDGYRKGVVMNPECFIAGIDGFPTWVIKGEVYSGEKTLEELAQISVAEELSSTSGIRWNCTCSSAHQEAQNSVIAANCSASCDCEPVATGSTNNKWMCICDSGLSPTVETDDKNNKCFTACNCTSGSFTDTKASRKHISSKIVVIILLICLVLTTVALIASLVCYFYQRSKYKPQKFISDKGSSYNSGTYLIRHKTVPASGINLGFLTNPVSGCIGVASLLCERRIGIIHSTVIHFPYSELEHATNKFSDANLIGVGGSSHVYRGHLKDGRTVAVKRLETSKGLDSDSEFLKEVEILSRLHHCHIVPLLGYCTISLGIHIERLLVFEYLPNGNLRDCLNGTSGKYLDWSTRVSIALGAARGLEYLHEAAAPRILHRDVKSTNILLDENWKAKVTDLGMAKRLSIDGFPSCSSSPDRMEGTFGYFAPEYAIIGKGSLKSDVFSFGVVLLELITGRTPIFSITDKGDESLVIWAAPRLQNSKRVISELPDPHLKGNFPEEEMQIVAYLAKECLLLDPDSRPTMSEVVQILSNVAPDLSRRRRFSINLIKNLSSHSTKSQVAVPEKFTDQIEVLIDSEELKQLPPSRWSSPCSFSSDVDRTLVADSIGQEVHLSSHQYINRMLLLTSNGKSWNTNNDDEIVDLTEPRLETFCVGNGQ